MCKDIQYIKKCFHCGEKFTASHNNQKYCDVHKATGTAPAAALTYFKTRKGRKNLTKAMSKYHKTELGREKLRKQYAKHRDKRVAKARQWYLANEELCQARARARYLKKKALKNDSTNETNNSQSTELS